MQLTVDIDVANLHRDFWFINPYIIEVDTSMSNNDLN